LFQGIIEKRIEDMKKFMLCILFSLVVLTTSCKTVNPSGEGQINPVLNTDKFSDYNPWWNTNQNSEVQNVK
jgi:hypothetical protein